MMDKAQLDELRRLAEEDFRLDIAAIERLQRRFTDALNSSDASRRFGEASNSSDAPRRFNEASIGGEAPRRFSEAPSPVANDAPINSAPLTTYSSMKESMKEWSERESAAEPSNAPAARPEWKTDGLESSLRTMFNVGRK